MSQPPILPVEADRILESAYPKQGVTWAKPGGPTGAYKVLKANGEVIGSAFNLRDALRQAVQPALKAEAARRLEEDKAKTELFKAFHLFLREKFNDEFVQWVEAKNQSQASNGVGTANDPPRLVSLVP